jgi:hypothetical protein
LTQGEWSADKSDKNDAETQFTTPRTLLSILRMAQALARIRFSEQVSQMDVDEAMRLIVSSKSSLFEERTQRSGLPWLPRACTCFAHAERGCAKQAQLLLNLLLWSSQRPAIGPDVGHLPRHP